jgi:hypothetical protein
VRNPHWREDFQSQTSGEAAVSEPRPAWDNVVMRPRIACLIHPFFSASVLDSYRRDRKTGDREERVRERKPGSRARTPSGVHRPGRFALEAFPRAGWSS